MNKVVVITVATVTFLSLLTVNALGAVIIGGSYQPSGSVVKLTRSNYQWITQPAPVTPVTPKHTTPVTGVWVVTPAPTKPVVTVPPVVPVPPVAPIPPVTGLTADEQAMVNDINRERVNAGIAPVKVDMRLMTVGRLKANDMVVNHYFDHTSPVYGSAWAMMTAQGVKYKYAGENIAGNRTTTGAMSGWMLSIGHRTNILNPSFTHIGVGVGYQSSPYNIYVQEFAQE